MSNVFISGAEADWRAAVQRWPYIKYDIYIYIYIYTYIYIYIHIYIYIILGRAEAGGRGVAQCWSPAGGSRLRRGVVRFLGEILYYVILYYITLCFIILYYVILYYSIVQPVFMCAMSV
jgi:hypothetical protein